jgi:hypothetical protein
VCIYSGGDSNGTSGAAAALLQNDTAMISVANRVIAVGYIILSLRCGEQKGGIRCSPLILRFHDAHRGDGKRFILSVDEKLTEFLELEFAVCAAVMIRILAACAVAVSAAGFS